MMISYAVHPKTHQTFEDAYVRSIYNKIASHFSDTRSYKWSWVTEFVTSFPKGSMIYDIGCGSGRNMEYDDYSFVGVDNCAEFLSICRSKKLNVVESNMTSLPFEDESTDGLMCIAAFHHLCHEERRLDALREMRRVIRDDGRILISVWSFVQPEKTRRKFTDYGDTLVPWKKNDGAHYNRYYYIFRIDEIEALFSEAGLHIEKHLWDTGNEVFILTKSNRKYIT